MQVPSTDSDLTVFFVCILVTLAITLTLLWYGWRHRSQVGAVAFCIGIGSQGLWTLSFVLFSASPQLSYKLIAEYLEWSADFISVLAMLWFALEYVGHPWARCRKMWLIVGLPAVFFLGMAYTNSWHGLFFGNPTLVYRPPFNGLNYDDTPLAEIANWYGYALALGALGLMVRHYFSTSPWFRIQVAIIIVGLAMLMASSGIALTIDTNVHSPLDGLPFVLLYAVGSVILSMGYFRLHLFDLSPIARSLVIDTLAEAVIVLDQEGRVVDINVGARKHLFHAFPTVIGQPIAAVFPHLGDDLNAVLTAERAQHRFIVGGQHFELKLQPIYDAHQRAIGKLMLITDMTEQERLAEANAREMRLKLALDKEHELSTLKSAMMARIAHEFRTPLSSISLNGDMLERYFGRMSETHRHDKILEIQHQVEHLTEMMNDIEMVVRERSEQSNAHFTLFDVGSLCHGTIQVVAGNFGDQCSLTVTTQSDGQRIQADPEAIHVILLNLLSNAIKFSPRGSTVRLDQCMESDDLILRVTDEGIGICEADRQRIFEPFFRGSNAEQTGGLGLGLTIVQVLVNAHNGSIELQSVLGQGTEITVRLPHVGVNAPGAASTAGSPTLEPRKPSPPLQPAPRRPVVIRTRL